MNLIVIALRTEYSSSRSVGPTVMSRRLRLDMVMVQLINALAGSESIAISQSSKFSNVIKPQSIHDTADVRIEVDGTRQRLHSIKATQTTRRSSIAARLNVLQLCKMPNDCFHVPSRCLSSSYRSLSSYHTLAISPKKKTAQRVPLSQHNACMSVE